MDKTTSRADSRDLTQGSVVKKLVMFALPLIASNLIMQLYNIVDSIIVGNFIGSDAIAAVGSSFPIMMLFFSMFMGVATGAGIVVAQNCGAKNQEGLKKTVSTTFTLAIYIGVFITVVGLIITRPLLTLLGTPANIMSDATAYLTIIFAGMLGNTIYSIGGGILRGMGDSKGPLYILIISSILNALLASFFVIVCGWGVAGTATATIISQTLSGILVYFRINKGGYGVSVSFRSLKMDKPMLKLIVALGLPTGIQQMTMSIGGMIIQSFSNRFGSDLIAANSIIMRADGFVIMPMMGIGLALTTFVGQNMGAGKLDRAKHGIRAAALTVIGIGVTMGVVLWFCGIYIMRAFTDTQAVLEMGKQGIRVLAFFYCFMGLDQCFAGAMRGAGQAIAPMITGLIANLMRIPLAYFIAVVPMNYMGLFYAMAATMVLGATMIFTYYKTGKWQNKTIVKAES